MESRAKLTHEIIRDGGAKHFKNQQTGEEFVVYGVQGQQWSVFLQDLTHPEFALVSLFLEPIDSSTMTGNRFW